MADTEVNINDLEDGEIESDGEDNSEIHNEVKLENKLDNEELAQGKIETKEYYYTKSGKKKKSKSNKGDQKFKDKNKKKKYGSLCEDDFAGNIEKAIRKAMNPNEGGDVDVNEERRKHKKRKKYEGKDGPSKKRKKQDYSEEMDESEMMCVRGASPVQRQSPSDMYGEDDRDSYASDSSNESRQGHQHQRPQRHNRPQRDRNKNNKGERRRGAHPMQDPDGVCLYFMQGKCHKGDDCIYSHDAQPPRKMELCKFYLMDCCAKRDKCLYMHSDFPCKYYHTGLPCLYKDECKFAHGKPLTDNLKSILLKHIESAPKEILGDFPRLNREGALKMIQTTQAKLIQQFSDPSDYNDRCIPSLFELNIPTPQNMTENMQINPFCIDKQNKMSPKIRQSRWQNDHSNPNYNMNLSPGSSSSNNSNVLNIKNLTGVLTPRQISDLTKMGIDNLDQLGQLTVLQLNSIGISLKQITEIQMNTMSIQKLGLLNSSEQNSQSFTMPTAVAKDLDLRIPPPVVSLPVSAPTEMPGQDVDMRFQPSASVAVKEEPSMIVVKKEHQPSKDMIDIDQYTKDALKYAVKMERIDKENIDVSNECFDEKPLSIESKDVDHRVLPFTNDEVKVPVPSASKEVDTDIRFLRPEPIFKSTDKRNRRSTTDDEDNNLLIDEKWYSSDEEKGVRKRSPVSSPQPLLSPQPAPHVIEPASVLNRIGDLSKIDISEEVTKLLNTMKNNLHETKSDSQSEATESPKSRDPRSRRSPEKSADVPSKVLNKKSSRVSIYECVDGEPTDGRRRSDVDLRKSDFPSFGDTDLRQGSSGDIDLRLGLPFKAIPNYTPASEINGSINSHPPIPFKLVPIHIPRPDYTDIRNSTAKSQAMLDPRLRKVFRLSIDESNSDGEKPPKPAPAPVPRIDPRRKKEIENNQEQKTSSLDIQTVLQNSNWFKDLSSTQKIFVNQHLMPITQMLKQYHQEKIPGKFFDLSSIQNNQVIGSIFTNLGVSLDENGEYSYVPNPKTLNTSVNLNQPPNPHVMEGASNMAVLNMSPMGMGGVGGMGNMNVGPLHGYNQGLPDPRSASGPTPGLLGIAPNMPYNMALNTNFGVPNNYGNMGFNGQNPGNDFNFMEGDKNFQRFPNRGGHRGRGNDRWNRGGNGRGQRKNFNDRGNWKNDRH